MTAIAFTGHRPKDLPIGARAMFLSALAKVMEQDHLQHPHFIVGGALGTDTWAAEFALAHGIEFTLILPFRPEVMARFWTESQQALLRVQTMRSHSTQIVHEGNYAPWAYQRRNEEMVNRASVLLAVWTGKSWGGTWNCIEYARTIPDLPIFNLWPLDGQLGKI